MSKIPPHSNSVNHAANQKRMIDQDLQKKEFRKQMQQKQMIKEQQKRKKEQMDQQDDQLLEDGYSESSKDVQNHEGVFSLAKSQQDRALSVLKNDESMLNHEDRLDAIHDDQRHKDEDQQDDDQQHIYEIHNQVQQFSLAIEHDAEQVQENNNHRLEIIEQMVSHMSFSAGGDGVRMQLKEQLFPGTELHIRYPTPNDIELNFIASSSEVVQWAHQQTQTLRELLELRLRRRVTVRVTSVSDKNMETDALHRKAHMKGRV
jgi:hypothetical protein